LARGAALLDAVEHGLDRNALAANIAFLPDPRIDRDHIALAGSLDAVTAEEQHHDAVGLDLGLQPTDRALHVVAAGIFHHVDIEAALAQRRGERARIVDRLVQGLRGVWVMTVADDERELALLVDGVGLLGADCLGGIQRALVEGGVGADRQRNHADKAGDQSDRTTGDVELPNIHHGSSWSSSKRAGDQ
jgi:hypothetical protein